MNNDKKITIKRLIIFLVISFIPFMILIPILWKVYGGPIYVSGNEKTTVTVYIVSVLGMMIPSIAVLITRFITKEGFSDSYLGLNIKAKGGYWAASIIIPLIEGFAGLFLMWAVLMNGISFTEAFPGADLQKTGAFLIQFSASVIIFFPAFGEEWGWRGYMMPKLLKLMPKPAAIITGGIIWGLWHAPLTIAGHNFGNGYWGYPFTGIALMCLYCTLMNCLLTLITEKTRSIYPASFFHMLHNNINVLILLPLFGSEPAITRVAAYNGIEINLLLLCISLITAVVSFILFVKKENIKPGVI